MPRPNSNNRQGRQDLCMGAGVVRVQAAFCNICGSLFNDNDEKTWRAIKLRQPTNLNFYHVDCIAPTRAACLML